MIINSIILQQYKEFVKTFEKKLIESVIQSNLKLHNPNSLTILECHFNIYRSKSKYDPRNLDHTYRRTKPPSNEDC